MSSSDECSDDSASVSECLSEWDPFSSDEEWEDDNDDDDDLPALFSLANVDSVYHMGDDVGFKALGRILGKGARSTARGAARGASKKGKSLLRRRSGSRSKRREKKKEKKKEEKTDDAPQDDAQEGRSDEGPNGGGPGGGQTDCLTEVRQLDEAARSGRPKFLTKLKKLFRRNKRKRCVKDFDRLAGKGWKGYRKYRRRELKKSVSFNPLLDANLSLFQMDVGFLVEKGIEAAETTDAFRASLLNAEVHALYRSCLRRKMALDELLSDV